MKLHVLIDNLPNPENPMLQHEHGLSLLLQTPQGKNYLIDTGASGKFLQNLELLREQAPSLPTAAEIDAVIISHGHNDHTGGLRTFLEHNTTAPVYLHNTIRGNLFYSCRPKNGIREARNIGMEQALFAEYGHRFREIDSLTGISEQITLIPVSSSAGHPTPMGNSFLHCNDLPDNFTHEIAILAEYTPGEFAIISPCSHNGILNILEVTSSFCTKVTLSLCTTASKSVGFFIGGLHYVDYLHHDDTKKEAAHIVQAAEYIKEHYPNLKVISGHCTGNDARQVLQNSLKENYTHFSTGTVIELK
ncbi:MAG: MBL fold metallo-hydrolase [Bacteroidales bacterium]|nr:MBL fold metallo-hydrolase [Bacteroidales bacterium]